MLHVWIFFVASVAVAAVLVAVFYRNFTNNTKRSLKNLSVVAHSAPIRALPAYKAARRRYSILLAAAAICLGLTLFSFTALAARPVSTESYQSDRDLRDIMLCLDVSGSTQNFRQGVLNNFNVIVDGLHGERIGVTFFDSIPINVIPLTDDYAAITDLIKEVSANGFMTATMPLSYNGTSNIGEGLLGCVNSFPDLGNTKRSQSIVFATDNMSESNKDIGITQAGNYAKRYGVTVYGILLSDNTNYNVVYNHDEFREMVESTHGIYYVLGKDNFSNGNITGDIIRKILDQEGAKTEGSRELLFVDNPSFFAIFGAISLIAFFVLIWRLRL